MTTIKKVLFLTPYPLKEAPSQRFRFEQYYGSLEKRNFAIQSQSFLTAANWRLFYGKGKNVQKALALAQGFIRRMKGLVEVTSTDFVFIHREAAPVGPPIFEWIIAKILRKKIIYDFDDAIWLTDRQHESLFMTITKCRGKVSTICKWSYRVSCGNLFLCNYARQFAKDVVFNPTTIDLDVHHPGDSTLPRTRSTVTIGWTGSHSTLKYLEQLEPVLKQVEESWPQVRFVVIADSRPALELKSLKFIPWREHTEINDLLEIDIGLMPLPDDEWSKGKCGFKILQYMALCIPSVSSAVGANKEIVQHGKNGFLCSSQEEWLACLALLIQRPDLREQFGQSGRETVVKHYSVTSNRSTFLSLFE